MLNSRDKQMIATDVANIIDSDSTTVRISRLLPNESQPSWNSILGEIAGDPVYNTIDNIPCEIYWQNENEVKNDLSGNKYGGKCYIHIPVSKCQVTDEYDGNTRSVNVWLPRNICTRIGIDSLVPIVIDDECIITIHDDSGIWRIFGIKSLHGEVIVTAKMIVGDDNGG